MSFGADIFTETLCGITPFLASIIIGDDQLAPQFIDMECHISGCTTNKNWKQFSQPVRELATILSPSFNHQNSESLSKLFFGAGETFPNWIYTPTTYSCYNSNGNKM